MFKLNHKARSKGTTLTEMSVVLALIGIVSVVVVSFSLMVHTRSMVATTRNRAADDLKMSKIVIENWIDEVSNTYGAEITVSLDGKSLMATINETLYKTELTEDNLNASLPDGKILSCPIDEINEFNFSNLKKMDGLILKDEIWFCSAHYLIPKIDGEPIPQHITFCVNSHIGDVVS